MSHEPAAMVRRARWALIPASLLPCLACGGDREGTEILLSGHVEATEVRVSSKIGGTIESLEVEEGERVQPGQAIARIDTVDLELALAAAEADLELARADLDLRLAGYRAEEIREAEAVAAAARAELEAAERDRARFEGLLAAGSGTEKARDDARTRARVAASNLAAAEERLRRLRAGFRGEEIAAARARGKAAAARIAQIRQQISDAAVLSPAGGVVTEKLAEAGELVAPGGGLAVITDLADAWLTAYLPEPDLGRVRLGQEARVETDDGEVRGGRLTFINDRAEFTPRNVQTRDERVKLVYRVKITLENRDGFFKPGMPAEAWLQPASEGPEPLR